jgi:DNA-binding MarR family transcriptional regulator
MRRSQDRAAPRAIAPLGPRHIAALEQLREEPLTVGTLAARLDLTLSTVSGVLTDLDRAGFIARYADTEDRRRTVVRITPAKTALIDEWLDGAAEPLARVLDQLSPSERATFGKVMDLLEAELRATDGGR